MSLFPVLANIFNVHFKIGRSCRPLSMLLKNFFTVNCKTIKFIFVLYLVPCGQNLFTRYSFCILYSMSTHAVVVGPQYRCWTSCNSRRVQPLISKSGNHCSFGRVIWLWFQAYPQSTILVCLLAHIPHRIEKKNIHFTRNGSDFG